MLVFAGKTGWASKRGPTASPDAATATTALTPGFISRELVYDAGLRAGWTMFTWLNGYQLLSVHGAA